MNLPANILLSDEFAEFSGKVTALHERKKELNAESVALQNDFAKPDSEEEK